jgi:hypothetical protein
MKRLIVPRSQRMTKSTVRPSSVVAVAMSSGRGALGSNGSHDAAVER